MLTGKNLGDAFARALELKKKSGAIKHNTEVAKHFGVQPPSLYDWIKKGSIAKDKLPELWRYFSDVVSPEHWGITRQDIENLSESLDFSPKGHDSGSDFSRTLPTPHPPQPIAPGPDFIAVERVNLKVSAGVTGFAIEHLNGNGPPIFFRADWLQAEGLRADRLLALRVSGDSMEPSLWDGDLVVINTAATEPKDGVAFVLNYEGEVLIKRLERDAGEWWLTSDNQRYKRKRCDEHAILVGRVIYKQSGRI